MSEKWRSILYQSFGFLIGGLVGYLGGIKGIAFLTVGCLWILLVQLNSRNI